MTAIENAVTGSSDGLWTVITWVLLSAGVWVCFRTVVVQIRMGPEMFRSLTEKPSDISKDKKGISAFKAFTISAASRVGTGNIAGVAVAITIGGPGAVFWMWLVAIVGGATAFVESTLAQLYKVKDTDSYRGGPAYYITKGLNLKWLAAVFVVAITVTYGFVYNAVQSNSIVDAITESTGSDAMWWKALLGVALAILTALIVFGGVQRIASVTNWLVPIMAVLYIVTGFIVVAVNIEQVPHMFAEIVTSALGIREVAGATFGQAFMYGIRRGLFSNEAGEGSIPNAAATASVSHPVKQGLIQTLGVYFDTIIVCSITAFIILLNNPSFGEGVESTSLTQNSVAAAVGHWGVHLVTVIIFFLAFSSVIGNYYYGESNIEFFTRNNKVMTAYRFLVCLCVLGGSLGKVGIVWALADLFAGIMVAINLTAILPLGGAAIALLKNYRQQRNQGLSPVFHRDDLPNLPGHDRIECWDGSDPLTIRGDGQEVYGRRPGTPAPQVIRRSANGSVRAE